MEFDNKEWKVYTWKNWMILHWIINPAIAFNELILGQRIPKISLEDKTSDKPRLERTYIPCPHCETIHDGRVWAKSRAFKNWYGLYCPNCNKVIPCLINVFSFLILALTYPIWGWFRNSLKENWLRKQPKRFENVVASEIQNPYEGYGWIKIGLIFGLLMFILNTIIFPIFSQMDITFLV